MLEPMPSLLLAMRPPGAEAAGVSDVRGLLERAGMGLERASPLGEPVAPHARWSIEVEGAFAGDAEPGTFRAFLAPAPRELIQSILHSGVEWRGVLPEDGRDGSASTWMIGVEHVLGEAVLHDFHRQLRVLAALAPDTVFVLDTAAVTPHPGQWLRERAASRVPPSPQELYTIHCVGNDPGAPVWLHTHGLLRCGCIELDMMDIPPDLAGLCAKMLNVVAAMFLESGVPEPDEPFTVGQDMELLWLPWEEGIRRAPRGVSGGRADRQEPEHAGPRGVLFAPGRGLLGRKFRSPAVYRELLENNPVFYVSHMETERAALLAVERLPRFRALFERFGADEESYLFLLKLGYEVDGASTELEREHLWFRVHGFAGDEVDATLLNQPYGIAAMHEGQRGRHAVARLSDFAILCEHGRFGPDTVGELERLVGG